MLCFFFGLEHICSSVRVNASNETLQDVQKMIKKPAIATVPILSQTRLVKIQPTQLTSHCAISLS